MTIYSLSALSEVWNVTMWDNICFKIDLKPALSQVLYHNFLPFAHHSPFQTNLGVKMSIKLPHLPDSLTTKDGILMAWNIA